MKRFFSGLVLFCCAALLCLGQAQADSDSLPQEIRQYFAAGAYAQARITGQAAWSGKGEEAFFFVLVQDKAGTNILFQFHQRAGAWAYDFHTAKAVPQGEHKVLVYVSQGGEDWGNGLVYPGPQLVLTQEDEAGEYTQVYTAYQLSPEGSFQLFRAWNREEDASMEVLNDRIVYFRELESAQVAGIAYGAIRRDLKDFDLSTLPGTLLEAKTRLNADPDAPASNRAYNLASYSASTGQTLFHGVLTLFADGSLDVYARPDPEIALDLPNLMEIAVYDAQTKALVSRLLPDEDGLFFGAAKPTHIPSSFLLIPIHSNGKELTDYTLEIPVK